MAWLRLCLPVLILATAATSLNDDPRLAAELECLDNAPEDNCNMEVIYPEPVGSLLCDAKTAEKDASALEEHPQLRVYSTLAGTKGLLIMFDPDAPVSENPSLGFVHLLAEVTVDPDGYIKEDNVITEYYKPYPPKGRGEHRYQFFLYEYDSVKHVPKSTDRKFQLCDYLRRHNIGRQPLAAFQFRHIRH